MKNPVLEGEPDDGQTERLENWLTELKMICRQYGILLNTDDGETVIIDLYSATVIGIGLTYLLDESGTRITAYDCDGSILDGAWLIDTPEGSREQRHVHPPEKDHRS